MRFKSGSKVEVLCASGAHSGSWMSGEIVDGNGKYYTVRCGSNRGDRTEAVFRRVARKCLRPCPPLLKVWRWAPGDIVEICYDDSWKLASVVRAIDNDNYLVKIIGINQEFEARKCDIRVRLAWQDNKWIRTSKGRAGCAHLEIGVGYGDNVAAVRYIDNATDSHAVQSTSLKRTLPSDPCSLIDNSHKKRTIGIDRKLLQVVQVPKVKEVDVFTNPGKNKGGKYLRSPIDGSTPTCYNLQSQNPESFENSVKQSLEFHDSDCGVASSVGSCSVFSGRDRVLHSSDMAAVSSDADSFCTRGHEEETCTFSAAELHRYLECHDAMLKWCLATFPVAEDSGNTSYTVELSNMLIAACCHQVF
uniref:Agenet domain-containing protein n=1 Tax=Kalanchoe fedtschenkoi TaxID=63787 RepID=A0A7N0UZH7_KALFE